VVLGIVGTTVLGVVLTAHTGDLRWLFAGLPATLVLFLAARLGPTGYRLAGDGVCVERKAGPRANRESVVWLATDSGWIGLSPDRPDEFVDRLRRRLESCRVLGREAAEGRLS